MWRNGTCVPSLEALFQSTHPRRVWPFALTFTTNILEVSIHTPTKGVTLGYLPADWNLAVSIHTPTKGVTEWVHAPSVPRMSFNPHTHEGCDFSLYDYWIYRWVSIHTPTKGVTVYDTLYLDSLLFQSTHPRRVWLIFSLWYTLSIWFQSTHPRRVWLSSHLSLNITRPFQSTHPRRVWLYLLSSSFLISVFQSTHPRRVWQPLALPVTESSTFQSTHPRRVWPLDIWKRYK